MNERNVKPWPHSPGVIAQVGDVGFEIRIFGKTFHRANYEDAVEVCLQQKRLAAWHEEQLAARNPRPMFPNYSLADEMAV